MINNFKLVTCLIKFSNSHLYVYGKVIHIYDIVRSAKTQCALLTYLALCMYIYRNKLGEIQGE